MAHIANELTDLIILIKISLLRIRFNFFHYINHLIFRHIFEIEGVLSCIETIISEKADVIIRDVCIRANFLKVAVYLI
jgi:hypothetical protein